VCAGVGHVSVRCARDSVIELCAPVFAGVGQLRVSALSTGSRQCVVIDINGSGLNAGACEVKYIQIMKHCD
jgi:hypothetical protein